jgi:hypothetical protein
MVLRLKRSLRPDPDALIKSVEQQSHSQAVVVATPEARLI